MLTRKDKSKRSEKASRTVCDGVHNRDDALLYLARQYGRENLLSMPNKLYDPKGYK